MTDDDRQRVTEYAEKLKDSQAAFKEDKRKQIIALRKQGYSLQAIGERLGMSRQTVWNWINSK